MPHRGAVAFGPAGGALRAGDKSARIGASANPLSNSSFRRVGYIE
jgi:hypothetical protein